MTPRDIRVDVAVIGAGPTGLGAAWRLEELRTAGARADWILLESSSGAGGLASSTIDPQGFRWDLGGHVLFSHYAYFDAVLEQVLAPSEWLRHERARWVHLRGRWIPYPIQRNLHRLPIDDCVRCMRGLIEARERASTAPKPHSFAEWSRASFGGALDELFFTPFNRKMWATEPELMAVEWAGGRSGSHHANVPTVDLARLVENTLRGRDDPGWDGDTRFPYPRNGGTGAIWQRVLASLPGHRVRFESAVESIDPEQRVLRLADGSGVRYGTLVSGMPLDALLSKLAGGRELADAARGLRHTSVHAVGLGFDGPLPPELEGKLWIYFAEPAAPFYRGTLLSTYSPENVPEPGRQWSILLEVATTPDRPRDPAELVAACEASLREQNVVPEGTSTRSRWHRFLVRGYPVPTLGRDGILTEIDARLRAMRIWSRGRFGGWKYEVSNQDHSFHQGVEAVDEALLGVRETTWPQPDVANAGQVRPAAFGVEARA